MTTETAPFAEKKSSLDYLVLICGRNFHAHIFQFNYHGDALENALLFKTAYTPYPIYHGVLKQAWTFQYTPLAKHKHNWEGQ